MGNPIFDFFKFLYEDTKKDLKFLSDLAEGKAKVRKLTYEQKQELKDWKGILKANWLFFIIVIAAFCSGYFWGQVTLNNACVDTLETWFVQNEEFFTSPEMKDSISNAFNYSFNFNSS